MIQKSPVSHLGWAIKVIQKGQFGFDELTNKNWIEMHTEH